MVPPPAISCRPESISRSPPKSSPTEESPEESLPPCIWTAAACGWSIKSDATPDTAFFTMPRLFSMPFASPDMKSGIQLS